MKKIFLSLAAALGLSSAVDAQCSFTNLYPNATGWTMNGGCAGTCYTIASGFNFIATPGGGYDFATTATGCAMSDSCWCADIEFVYTGRSASGVAHTLLSFTSNTANSWNTPPFAVSNNNVIEAYLLSPLNGGPATDRIFGQSKLNTTWNTASTGIPVTVGNTYYIRLQRLSPTDGLISVFTNAARTIHAAGSPQCFPINASVTGLGTLQHGAIPQAGPLRTITGTLSNLTATNVNTGIKGIPSLICGKLIGSYNVSVVPVCGASNYTWSSTAGLTITGGNGTPNITASITSGSTSTVTCVISFPGVACGITYTMTVTHSPTPSVSASASPALVCFGSSTNLNATGTATSFSWLPTTGLSNPLIANPVATPTATTTYTVTGSNAAGCSRTATVTVTVNPPLTAITGPNDSTCCGAITYIGGTSGSASGGTPGYTYSWNPTTNFIGCTTCANPPVMDCSPTNSVTYTLTVTDAVGCTATNTITIWFNTAPCRVANPDANQDAVQDQKFIADVPVEMAVMPNPSNGNFLITLPGAGFHDVEVVNLLGEIVYRKSGIADATLSVDLSTQPKGVYLVKCTEGAQTFVRRIVIQ